MTYELAKQLKGAGFEQNIEVGEKYYRFTGHPRMGIPYQYAVNTSFITHVIKEDEVKIPTLSELIEACGDDFWRLEWYQKDQYIHPIGIREEDKNMPEHLKWSATDKTGHGCMASTPEEAVANLYLALHKNNGNS